MTGCTVIHTHANQYYLVSDRVYHDTHPHQPVLLGKWQGVPWYTHTPTNTTWYVTGCTMIHTHQPVLLGKWQGIPWYTHTNQYYLVSDRVYHDTHTHQPALLGKWQGIPWYTHINQYYLVSGRECTMIHTHANQYYLVSDTVYHDTHTHQPVLLGKWQGVPWYTPTPTNTTW